MEKQEKTKELSKIESLLDRKLEPIVKSLEDMMTKISKLDSIEQSLIFLSNRYDELVEKVEKLESENENLAQENGNLKIEMHRTTNCISQLKEELNELEQYGRRDCLEIRGIPVVEDEDTDNLVKQVGQLIDVEVEEDDISISHRLFAPRSQGGSRNRAIQDPAIIVKFVRRNLRDEFYSARSQLRSKTTRDLGMMRINERKIFITESLTQQNRKIFNRCLQAKRELKFQFLWTSHGKILLRKDGSSPAITITKDSDLDRVYDQH